MELHTHEKLENYDVWEIVECLEIAVGLNGIKGVPWSCIRDGLLSYVVEASRHLACEEFKLVYEVAMKNEDRLPRNFIDEIKFQGELRGLCEAPGE